jgi:hypothetical protein
VTVEPIYLSVDKICRHEPSLGEDLGDFGLLVRLKRKGGGLVTTDWRQLKSFSTNANKLLTWYPFGSCFLIHSWGVWG